MTQFEKNSKSLSLIKVWDKNLVVHICKTFCVSEKADLT